MPIHAEMEVAWANPGSFTVHNYACYEDGSNCVTTKYYEDPSQHIEKVNARLQAEKKKKNLKSATKNGIRG